MQVECVVKCMQLEQCFVKCTHRPQSMVQVLALQTQTGWNMVPLNSLKSSAWPSPAQRSTAQHSTAEHSAAWPSAAQCHMTCRGGSQRGGFGQRGNPYGGGGVYGGRGQRGGGGGNILLSPQVIGIFTNLFLQLPFSRRAEAEADLIGLKLMGLAGYDPQVLSQLPGHVCWSCSCTAYLSSRELILQQPILQ